MTLRKTKLLVTVATLAMVAASSAISLAAAKTVPHTWVDAHIGGGRDAGLGIARQVTSKVWAGIRMDGLGSSDPLASLNVLYKVPKQLWLVEPYAGGGLDYNLTSGEVGSHIVIGAKLLCFFVEDEYRLIDRGATERAGLRVAF